jgi:DNA-binding PadR family transcriptional regulator
METGRYAVHVLEALNGQGLHGYGIVQEVRRQTDGKTVLMPGALFSTVSGLLRSGLIEVHRSVPSHGEDNVPSYRATRLGRRVVAARLAALSQVAESDAESERAMQSPGGGA